MADRDRNTDAAPAKPKYFPFGWFGALPNDSPAKAIVMTLLVSFAASVLVAGSTVLLRPLQQENIRLEQKKRILDIVLGARGAAGKKPAVDARDLEPRVVDLATGDYVASIDAETFDQRQAAKDPAQSVPIPGDQDFAKLQRRSKYATVYVLEKEGGRPGAIILPVHGKGFASTMYGYLGLSVDTRTVIGLVFYEHGETPGLGAQIDDPGWRAQWAGKMTWDESGQPRLGVAAGRVAKGDPDAAYRVDALTGATYTGRGVTNLLRYWLGSHGFGPYLKKIREQRDPA